MKLGDPDPPRRRLSLTPLIDVVFLLLVFFMLASTFLKFGTVRIETAGAGAEGRPDPKTLALVHVGAEQQYRVNGQSVSPDALESTFRSLIAQGRTSAILIMRKDAKVDDLIRGLTTARLSGFKTVRVVD